ncbi:hypothetical protein [Candidatus Magnetomonas plexicatena]|uniref:hypothetical protein n=1 Tax=Candidatus Magnetomonas plexicatena TaxID=2552947 RepID=UPI001C778D0A|nr:hypothetical protein E2O03_010775 [Nitrospirales bacterium LBB_01]
MISSDEILRNYLNCKYIIINSKSFVENKDAEQEINSEFIYETKETEQKIKMELLEEMKLCSSFNMLANFEAVVRKDFNRTISSKLKDKLSKEFIALCDKHYTKSNKDKKREKFCSKIPFDDILDKIKKYFKESYDPFHSQCSILKGYFTFRHWYAHGRSTRHSSVNIQIPDPEDLKELYIEFGKNVFYRTKNLQKPKP